MFAALATLTIAALFVATLLMRPAGEREARAAVEGFGARLQKVSLLATDASLVIEEEYGAFVEPALLARWQHEPLEAPGRQASSPWPDRIEIVRVARQGSGYVVEGEIVLRTSAGDAGRTPVIIQLVPSDEGYRIAAFEEQEGI